MATVPMRPTVVIPQRATSRRADAARPDISARPTAKVS
ncbi:hypothetical protein SGL43_03697 [Streptomyces globisporus]|uniref:Uncharacterized protein n=1 Tax=Streptomyces globisporus TaxID=1908 RepID=A0ABM9GZC4_STRGL|nr:hypothetical protein SGL43_03697 [Streptomyces globisporus]